MTAETIIFEHGGVIYDVGTLLVLGMTLFCVLCVLLFAAFTIFVLRGGSRIFMGVWTAVCGLLVSPVAFTLARQLLYAYS